MIKINYKYIETRLNEAKARIAEVITATYQEYGNANSVPSVKKLIEGQIADAIRDIKKEFNLK